MPKESVSNHQPAIISMHTLQHLFVYPEDALGFDSHTWSALIIVLRHEKLLARYAQRIDVAVGLNTLPEFVHRHCRSAMTLAERHAKQVHFELSELAELMQQSSQTWLVLKGAAYTASGHAVAAGRIYNDIDLLVDKSSMASAERALVMNGWLPQTIDDYDQAYYRQWAHEIPPLRHGYRGTMLDLHHNLVPPVSGRAPDMSLLFEYIEITPQQIPILTLPAMTLHSAIHLFFNEDFSASLRDTTDLYLLFNAFSKDDWESVVMLADKTKFTTELALAMHCVSELFYITLTARQQAYIEQHTHRRQRAWLLMALSSEHPVIRPPGHWRYSAYAWLRGHALKMPLGILLYHLMMKTGRAIMQSMFGQHIFTKQDQGTPRVSND